MPEQFAIGQRQGRRWAAMIEPRPLSYRDAPPERSAIRDALLELAAERGLAGLDLAELLVRAGVDRCTFRWHFVDLPDCCGQIYREDISELDRVLLGAYESQDAWLSGLRALGYALGRFFAARPLATYFDLIEMFSTGDLARAERDRYAQRMVDLVDRGRQHLSDPDLLSRAVAENAVGSIVELLYRRVRERGYLPDSDAFVPELLYMVVRPYVGHRVAIAELTIPPPPTPDDHLKVPGSPKVSWRKGASASSEQSTPVHHPVREARLSTAPSPIFSPRDRA